MQASDFKNNLIQSHFVQLIESHNLIFQFATEAEAEDKDKEKFVDPSFKQMMRWPEHVNTIYDYRTMWGGD